MARVGWEEQGRQVHRCGFANPWNAISAGVGSQHSSWLELCLEWIFLNESFKQKPWNTQNSSGVQWIGSFIQILSKTPSTSTVSGTFSSDYLFPPTLSAVSISKELLDHSYFFKGYFTCVYWLKYIVILHKIPGFGTFFLYCTNLHYSLGKWLQFDEQMQQGLEIWAPERSPKTSLSGWQGKALLSPQKIKFKRKFSSHSFFHLFFSLTWTKVQGGWGKLPQFARSSKNHPLLESIFPSFFNN